MAKKYRYRYEGPVIVSDRLGCARWSTEIVAVDERIARVKLSKEFKKEQKLPENIRILVPGKLRVVGTLM